MLASQLPNEEWTLEAAAHLLNRAAFGGAPADIQMLHLMGHRQAVDFILTTKKNDQISNLDPIKDLLVPELKKISNKAQFQLENEIKEDTTWEKTIIRALGGITADNKKQKRKLEGLLNKNIKFKIRNLWLNHIAATTFCSKDKLAIFWHSHLPVEYDRQSNGVTIKKYLDKIRNFGMGRFPILLNAVSKDFEMSHYLDLKDNKAGKINENFARELLELFTLGEGNYSETDIKETARVFTGFTFDENYEWYLNKKKHDKGIKTIFGQSNAFSPDEVIDMLTKKRECCEHIGVKLWKFYVSEEVDPNLTKALGALYQECGLDTSLFLKQIFLSKKFYSPKYVRRQIKSPIELVIHSLRHLELVKLPSQLEEKFNAMGQVLFSPPNVKGWPGGANWITAATLLTRYDVINIISTYVSDSNIKKLLPDNYSSALVCNHLSARLFHSPPPSKLREKFVSFMKETDYRNVRNKRELLRLMMSTPHYQLT